MYELVTTVWQQKRFETTWESICSKEGWYNDPYGENGVRYNLLLPRRLPFYPKKVIGTIEFIPFDPKNPNSTVEGPTRSKFSAYEDIMRFQSRTWEIDKLCIHEAYQRKGYFQEFMTIFYDHATNHHPKYYIALVERKLLRMLRICFGFAVEQRGEALPGENTDLVPIVFDIESIIQDKQAVAKYLNA